MKNAPSLRAGTAMLPAALGVPDKLAPGPSAVMKRLSTILALALTFLAANSIAQTSGDIVAGRQLSLRVCAACHQVTADEARGQAPSFAAIANLPSTTQMALHAFLSTPHANMPNLVLKPQEQNDVIGYILSLRKSP